jgi:solute carrier family 45 protein 1/2/4
MNNYASYYYRLFAINSWAVCCGVGWAVFFVLATPYFAIYGVSPFWTSFAVASGPVSGLLQPLFGLVSDVSTNSWGRRRPWILAGIIVALFGMLLFPTAQYFGRLSNDPDTDKSITITLAVIALWFFNIGLNMVQVHLSFFVFFFHVLLIQGVWICLGGGQS